MEQQREQSSSEDGDESGEDDDSPTRTLEQLLELRKLYRSWGWDSKCVEVVKLEEEVAAAREADMADKPAHERIAKVDKAVRLCKDAITAAQAKHDKLRKQLEECQTAPAKQEGEIQRAKKELEDAEAKREATLQKLQSGADEALEHAACEAFAKMVAAIGDDSFARLPLGKQALLDAAQALTRNLPAREAEAKAETKAEGSKLGGDDALAASVPGVAPDPGSSSSNRDVSMDDVEGALKGDAFAGIDDGTKRKLAEAVLHSAVRRRT